MTSDEKQAASDGAESQPPFTLARLEPTKREKVMASWVGRMLLSGGAVGSVAARAAAGSLGRLIVPGRRADELRTEELERLADQIYTTFGNLKGPLMKLAQMVSYVDLALPSHVQDMLGKLQDRAQPLASTAIERIVREDLGAPPQELFSLWTPDPFAAASIGQVHRAVMPDGREVAVKVQYPEIVRAFKTDLKNATALKALASPLFRNIDTADIVDEIRDVLLGETDYRVEAKNQSDFAHIYRGDPEILVPAVVPERSSARVLTSELIAGQRFAEFAASSTQPRRNQAALVMMRYAFESIFRHQMFNCDPHPGNYLFLQDGRVGFLDYGCVKRFSPDFVQGWRRMIRSVLERDRPAFERVVTELRIAPDPTRFNFDYHWKVSLYLYQPWLVDRPFRYTKEYAAESVRVLVLDNPNQLRVNVPKDFVFVNRLQWGLNSVLARLDAQASWRPLLLGLLYAPDETPPPPFTEEEMAY
jgi:predicted unusual protein kinase regulating ubiquinone biosynthesis (AarF/ABC1/UbiB family)